mmetsp:Transcript_9588/g.14435  ORF Transcript_9588/g.14435 Transcript_9588/m.14435 type:complete len:328 (+) Transcript_9588:106-1089(+)|eukprot:CAMPEP_0185033964 /NCGR_PEP_ID=MMETSP1103-20130426/23413_1 /TAXON_ID=36769 /ORGANISM="Paraphysomonas bandaiensis, Strain Caron Lab Isolate" /LENGTH=327 /DNA_ID=CAMNT_0027570425 /DNA_START=49 /DNA_END=1032 /DNA_ORIENTATION=-
MQFIDLIPRHGDIVNDIAFDYLGKRFASCSSKIKVWDLDEDTKTWSCYDIPRIHQDIIWRLSWAHPEFGQMFASCSEDKTVIIWEEQESVSGSDNKERGRWLKKTQLSDSKKSVNDVKFGPRQLGLKLAAGSADGMVRIYEANDVFSLGYWPLQDSFQAESTSGPDHIAEHGVTSLSWSDCPFESPKLVVGGYSKLAAVWSCDNGKWAQECVLESHGGPVHDVAWAPTMGRSYHLIASASREKSFKIHTLRRENGALVYSPDATQTVHTNSEVWRVAWNVTGTVLVTSAEDGSLGLWRRDFSGDWINVQNLPLVNAEPTKAMYGRVG